MLESEESTRIHRSSAKEQERTHGDVGDNWILLPGKDCSRMAKTALFHRLKRIIFLSVFILLVAVTYLISTRYNTQISNLLLFKESDDYKGKSAKFRNQRNELSRQLNLMKQAYGQQSCEKLKILAETGRGGDARVSENGGWCKETSSSHSNQHLWDKSFSTGLSKFLEGKTVGSFGDGPGTYKTHIDSLGQVKLYTAYDGAPYCENVTNGVVQFLDLTAPQYGLPVFDWVVSVEVGEHIPAKYEDIYLDNLVRHAREGIVLSWAHPGQPGLSHVNNKPLDDVIRQMKIRGFDIDREAGKPLKNATRFLWLKSNIQVYQRIDPKSFNEEDA